MHKSFFARMVLLLFAFTLLSACARTEQPEPANPTPDATDTPTVAPTALPYHDAEGMYYYDTEDKDYGDSEFYIWVNDSTNDVWYDTDFTVAYGSGDTVETAIFNRNAAVEEDLGILLTTVPLGTYIGTDTTLRTLISAGEESFDIAMTNARSAATLSQEGLFCDLLRLDLDLEAPWWDANAAEQLAICQRLYLITGDIGLMAKKSLRGIIFDSKLAEEYGFTNLYVLADSGDWTAEEMIRESSLVGADLNGNDTVDGDDRFGYIFFNDSIAINLIGADVTIVGIDISGNPELQFWNDRTSDIWDLYCDFLYTDYASLNAEWYSVDAGNIFLSDRALFLSMELHSMEDMRKMESDFGILPTPKYDSEQSAYHTTVNPNVAAMLTVPVNCSDTDRVCVVLEALGAASANIVTPAYRDVYLNTKAARDDDTGRMLDLIFDTVRYDIGYIYNWGEIGSLTPVMLYSKQTDLASRYEAIQTVAEQAMAEARKNYENLP